MKSTTSGITKFIWPIIVLALGLYLILVLKTFFADMNKINAATNSANCQIAMGKVAEKIDEQPLICKYILDSAQR